jgi:hypothetical protein
MSAVAANGLGQGIMTELFLSSFQIYPPPTYAGFP